MADAAKQNEEQGNKEEGNEEEGNGEQEGDKKKTTKKDTQRGKRRNFAMICLAFTCVYTALNAISNLQSSINTDQDIGLRSLAISSSGAIVACLLLTTPLVYIFGYKWSIVLGQVGIIAYVAANMYPKAVLMYPSKY